MAKELLDRVTVAIGGATGYGGLELVRLLSRHPGVRVTYLASSSAAGKRLEEIYPHMAEYGLKEDLDTRLQPLDLEAMARAAQVALFALPAGESAKIAPALLQAGMKVIDGGPDFRLKDAKAYARWYKFEHPAPKLLDEVAYGIPELHGEEISQTRLVAGPGCYPTAALLGLAPLLKGDLVAPDVIVDAASGLSGAGRTARKTEFHFPEAAEDFCAYGLPAHRHLPEMLQEAALLAAAEVAVTFTPHLAPMARGILATIYAPLRQPLGEASKREIMQAELLKRMRQFYAGSPFVHVSEALPHTKWAAGTNHAFLSVRISADGKKAIVLSALDNLGKGLASQMVQCLNVMCGFAETAGLEARAAYP